ncbi:UDP-4-amino-4,6-dideoxy-N-acetyl-beta-L-altrosamine transaminase [Candidatus Thioglobus sp.]|nr:UDP-4-amino-4,6-dideoxy-N-acetyl-beta-L-altrosamine transaminase [Candidatus Thioglobus sp.]
MISYGKQSIEQSDIDAVIGVMQSDMLTQGAYVEIFEKDLKNYFGSMNACAVANGTAALHLTAMALGWKHGDIILTSPLTFLATANCIVYVGATPDFVDIDPTTFTIDPNLLEEKIKMYLSLGNKVKAVIGVDYAGHPCDWKALRDIANRYDLQLVNDNCHALGASYFGDKCYAANYADVVTQSYHPVKHITTGEGGAILTNDSSIDEKVRSLRSHGMVRQVDNLKNTDRPWYYEMHEVGYNYRITDFQCALGSNQLKRLDQFIDKRRRIAQKYDELFINSVFTVPKSSSSIAHAYHLYPLQIDFNKLKLSKTDFFNKIKKVGISLQVHYIPVYLQPFYEKEFSFKAGYCRKAEIFYNQTFSIPIYPSLKDNEVEKVGFEVNKLIEIK